MKKASLVFLLLACAIFSSAFSIKEWRDSIYHQIKTETIKEIKKTFKKDVKIGRVEGIMVGQVVFNEVEIPNIARAKKVYINFNPITFLRKKDIVPAISKITIVEGEFKITRNKGEQWNFLSFLPEEEPGAPPSPAFRAKLVFKNCKADYSDQIGFRKEPQGFYERFSEINGEISFQKKDRISLKVYAKISGRNLTTSTKIAGSVNLKTNQYAINISADKVNLKKWGNYTVPLDFIKFKGGGADLSIKLTPPKTKGWPVSLAGNFSFTNARGEFGEYTIEETYGNLFMTDENLTLKNLSARINDLPILLNGRFFNFTKQNLDLRLSLKKTDLKKVVSFFPQTKDIDLGGVGESLFRVYGSVSDPEIKGKIVVTEGKIYQQDFSGEADLSYQQKFLKINIANLGLYKGTLSGKCDMDFSKEIPTLELSADLSEINLAPLAQNAPGITGEAKGKLNLSGPLNNLKGSLSANLSAASIFGQPIENLSSSFWIKEGEMLLESFMATSETASFSSTGKISRDLIFDFQAKAQGIKLSGEGILGSMEATTDFFEGKVSWKLDEKFLASPLKNLSASGRITLSQGRVGEQFFDQAQGRLSLGNGLIRIEDVVIKRKQSMLQASGQTGIGYPTDLKISGENINFSDLKILNYILPAEAKNPTGFTDIKFEITGEISKETQITSLDQLLKLDAKGEAILRGVNFAEIPVEQGRINLQWKDQTLIFSDCNLKILDSDLNFDLSYRRDNTIQGKISGIIDLYNLRKFTNKYGKLNGKLGLSLKLEGEANNPDLAAGFWIEDLHFNRVNFDKIEGSLVYSQNKLTLSKPVVFSSGPNQFEISGVANLEALRKGQPEESYLDLNLKILKAELPSFINLSEKIRSEFFQKFQAQATGEKSKINSSPFPLPLIQQYIQKGRIVLYSRNGKKEYFLKEWGQNIQEPINEVTEMVGESLGGELSGRFSLKGKVKKLSGNFIGQVKNGFYKSFAYDSLRVRGSLKEDKIKIENLELTKKGGRLFAQGEIGFDGALSLQLTAQHLPLDILKIYFDREFEGNFNMNASLEGSIQDPMISTVINSKNFKLAGIHFDQADLALTKKNGNLFIHELNLVNDKRSSNIHGTIELDSPGAINLEATLRDDALGLLNLFTKELKWLEGKASAQIKIKGSLEDPEINGEINISDTLVYVRALKSRIKEVEGAAKIEKSILTISSLTGIWQGARTKGFANYLGLAGTIDLSKSLAEKKMVDLNLSFSPTDLYADFPNLYTGVVKIKELKLFGPFLFDFSSGPTLSGNIHINNAVLTLAQKRRLPEKALPLNYDLSLVLEKNVYIVMGDITTFDLSNIFMNLEIKSEELKVSGSYAYPSLFGKIFLKRGTVTIFNRKFSLLSKEFQEDFYPFSAEKVKENVAFFSGEEGKEGVMPEVTITAKVEVENLEKDEAGELKKQKVIILSHLKGVIGASEKERGLDISFASFVEDKSKTPLEIRPGSYREQEVKVMLLPDFIKSLTGVSSGGEEAGVDANIVVADYLSGRVQTFVFRGIERELEHRLGLESLTLEYNFGKDIRQAMGVKEDRLLEEEKPDWRVGFAKGFFDKLYVDVRYAQAVAETGAEETYLNYQLTYKLSPIWSIIYYREPTSLQELDAGYQKVTLKAGFSFW